jgi:antitoxin (DNA-binding transcriptional repressor) of toxin-antitoxin stability system
MRADADRLVTETQILLDAAARGEEVIIERLGEPDLRIILQSQYVALTAATEPAAPNPTPARAGTPTGLAAPAQLVLDDQLAAEELVASIDAHQVGWEPWWKCDLPEVTVVYADRAQLELESRVAAAYGWQRDGEDDDSPRLRGGLAARLGLAPKRKRPNLTVTWKRTAIGS